MVAVDRESSSKALRRALPQLKNQVLKILKMMASTTSAMMAAKHGQMTVEKVGKIPTSQKTSPTKRGSRERALRGLAHRHTLDLKDLL